MPESDPNMAQRGDFAKDMAKAAGAKTPDMTKEESDAELVKRCKRMVDAGAEVTEQWANWWVAGLRYLFNDQLAEKRREKGWANVQMNVIYPALHQELALLAQRKPRIEAEAGVPGNEEALAKAAFWRGLSQRRYDKTLRMTTKTILATLDGAWCGMYVAYIWPDERAYWDKDRNRWVYEPRVDLLHPFYFGSDPNSETLDDSKFVFSRREMLIDEAERLWPEKKKQIEEGAKKYAETGDQLFMGRRMPAPPEQRKGEKERDTSWNAKVQGQLVDLITRARGSVAGGPALDRTDSRTGRQVVPITCVHFRDYEEEDAKDQEPYAADELLAQGALTADTSAVNQDGTPGPAVYRVADPEHPALAESTRTYQPGDLLSEADWPQKTTRKYKKPVYPFGRVVWMLNDEVLLNDKQEDQVWTRKNWPYVVGVRLPLPHVSQGLNGVEMAQGAQDWINVSAAHLLNHLKHFADPKTVHEEGIFAKGYKLKSIPGAIIQVLSGKLDRIKTLQPGELSPGIIQTFQIMVRQAQDALKQHDNALGAPAPRDQTATASSIQEAATHTAVGLSIVFLDAWILAVMEQVMELDREYLEPGDAVRLAGTTDTPEAVVEYTDEVADVDIDLKLNVGVALPHDVERRKADVERLQRMFPQNPYLWKWAAEAFDVPSKTEFVESMAEYQQFMAWREQMLAMQAAAEKESARSGVVPGAGGQPAAPLQGAPAGIAAGGQ